MTFRGVIKNGHVQLEDQGALPEGMTVDVQPSQKPARKGRQKPPKYDRASDPAFNIEQFAVSSGRRDGSAETDHYVYGSPKRGKPVPKSPRKKPGSQSRKRS